MYKSMKVEEEIDCAKNALFILNCSISNNILLADDNDYMRYILEIEKNDSTPDKYPRKPGKAKKKPLQFKGVGQWNSDLYYIRKMFHVKHFNL